MSIPRISRSLRRIIRRPCHDNEWAALAHEPLRMRELLDAEAQACDAFFEPAAPFMRKLYDEALLSNSSASSGSNAETHGPYTYFNEKSSRGYTVYYRRKETVEEILNTELLARTTGYADVPVVKISPDHTLLAYICDAIGNESYKLYIKDLRSQHISALENVRAMEFGASNKVFFTVMDDDRRASAVMVGTLGPNGIEGVVEVIRSADPSAHHDVSKSKDECMVFASVTISGQSEVIALDSAMLGKGECVVPARPKVEYFCEHREGRIFVISNHEGAFKVYVRNASGLVHYYSPPGDFAVEDCDMFHRGLVLYGYVCTQPRIIILPFDGTENARVLPATVAAGHIEPGVNADYWTPTFKYTIRSPTEKGITMECDFLRVSSDVRADVELTSLQVPARDGTYVPLTLLGDLSTPGPILVNVYGAYGTRFPLDYRLDRLQLVQRGWKIAFAHIRGGGENGLQWHHDGRLLNKHKSFLDLLDTLTLLRSRFKYAQICGKAESAGALVMGRALNHGLAASILNVPFVDPIAAMEDETLPLAKMEIGEWGDVKQAAYRDSLEALSPCAMQPSKTPLYITCAREDQRVPPFIPLKFADRQRRGRRNEPVVVRVLEHGHGGATGDGEQYEESCREIAFLHLVLNMPLE